MKSSSSSLSFAGTVKLIHPFHLQPFWCLTSQKFPSFPAEMLNSTFQEDNPSFKAVALSKTCWPLPSTSTECSLPQNLSWRDKSKPSPQTTSVLKPHALKQACRGLSSCDWGKHLDSYCSPHGFLLAGTHREDVCIGASLESKGLMNRTVGWKVTVPGCIYYCWLKTPPAAALPGAQLMWILPSTLWSILTQHTNCLSKHRWLFLSRTGRASTNFLANRGKCSQKDN